MNILSRDIKELSFKDIIEFCTLGYSEGSELDYKKETSDHFWDDLQKYVAAFANMRGGLIIIGVEEDKKTGKPVSWNGIDIDAKLVDRIDDIIADMDPTPNVVTHMVKDNNEEKAFILIRIFQGSDTPYYKRNDPNEWIRVGKISKPIEPASPQYKKFLFSQKDKATQERDNLIGESKAIRDGLNTIDFIKNTDPKSSLNISILPYLPDNVFLKPYELFENIPNFSFQTTAGSDYPPISGNFTTTQKGVYSLNHYNTTGQPFLLQLYSHGLVCYSTELYDGENIDGVMTQRIIYYLHLNLQLTRNYYQKIGHTGDLIVKIEFEPRIGLNMYRWYGDHYATTNKALKNLYSFDFNTSTRIFDNTDEYEDLLLEIYNEIFVSFGFKPISKELFLEKLKSF